MIPIAFSPNDFDAGTSFVDGEPTPTVIESAMGLEIVADDCGLLLLEALFTKYFMPASVSVDTCCRMLKPLI